MQLYAAVSAHYADFAAYAHGDSPCFEEWALGVAQDEELLAAIGTLPPVKQQPNLVFAAARWHGIPAPAPYARFRSGLLADWASIRGTVLSRATQTNEVGRLATLVPAFSRIQSEDARPLALLEVGASAGLCLYPDRYSYRWSTDSGIRSAAQPAAPGPILTCAVSGPAPLPDQLPVVGWRGGVDLQPLDVHDADSMAWLQNLVWPEQEERRARLEQAVDIARRDPPLLVRGDLLTALPELISRVPPDTTLMVFHSAVVAYLDPGDRARFQSLMTSLVADHACHWVSNEGKDVLPDVTSTGPDVPEDLATFVLGIDGRAVAWTHGHGRTMRWLEES